MESVPQSTLFSPQYLRSLPSACAALVGVAHEKAPGAAELGVNVAVRFDAVLDQRANERIDAVARAAPAVGALRYAGDKPRVIDQETHIRKAFRHDPDVAALAVLVGLLAERQSLVHADHFHAERARLLDEARADVVRQKKALAVNAPLRVASSTRDTFQRSFSSSIDSRSPG